MGKFMRLLLAVVLLALSIAPTFAETYTLQINNPRRIALLKVFVQGGTVTGEVCASRKVCTKQVTLPDGVCVAKVSTWTNNFNIASDVSFCGHDGKVVIGFQ